MYHLQLVMYAMNGAPLETKGWVNMLLTLKVYRGQPILASHEHH